MPIGAPLHEAHGDHLLRLPRLIQVAPTNQLLPIDQGSGSVLFPRSGVFPLSVRLELSEKPRGKLECRDPRSRSSGVRLIQRGSFHLDGRDTEGFLDLLSKPLLTDGAHAAVPVVEPADEH